MKDVIYKPLCADGWAIPPSPLMLKHGNDYYTCSTCGQPTKDTFNVATDATVSPRPPKVLTQKELDEIYFEAEYKLQNCIRVTLNVDSYTTEVHAAKGMWIPVTDYVVGLMEYMKDKQPRKYWVTNKDRPADNQRVLGPFTTAADAGIARQYIESKSGDHTFWIEELNS